MGRVIGLAAVLGVGLAGCDDAETSAGSGAAAASGGGAAGGMGGAGQGGEGGDSPMTSWSPAPPLPSPVSNNAVASLSSPKGCLILSAFGIDASRSQGGIHRKSFLWREGDARWRVIADVPVDQGRIAASAVALRGKFYVLGGYSVAPNMAETSHPEMNVYDPEADAWTAAAPLPTAIDDAVAVAWRDRWIVVVSGWADTQQPVDAVQIYDVEADRWEAGTPFAGTPVFGHSGAVVGDDLVVIGGVAANGSFVLGDQAWRGRLDPAAPTQITWTSLGTHPAPLRYRAAAAAHADGTSISFVGGTADAYNFDGFAYDGGGPATPLATALRYDVATSGFAPSSVSNKPEASMDHRGLASCGERLYTVGGMTAGPQVTADVWRYQP